MAELVPGLWGSLAVDEPLSDEEIDQKAGGILAQMSLAQKVNQMGGDEARLSGSLNMLTKGYNRQPIPAGEDHELGIPGIRFSDGPRGVVMGESTCFPVSMARGASFDTDLEGRIGDAIGVEARTQGANFFGGVCINLLRHPAWGRAQETYGEDPYLLGEMGSALVRGVQRHIMACAKHYAGNSIENARFKVDVQIDDRTLHEVYLPHFRRCADEGVASIMSAYNKVNGPYCGQSTRLLRQILKEQWGFDGFVISDFMWGTRDAKEAALAGMDIEMPFQQHFHKQLAKLVEKGEVPESVVDEAVTRILRQKIRFAQIGEPERYAEGVVAGDEHRALAREAAQKSIVLLKNDPVPATGLPLLPLDPFKKQSIAVIGRFSRKDNLGDHGSSRVRPPAVTTIFDGILKAAGSKVQIFDVDGKSISEAKKVAEQVDVAIVIAGYGPRDEGEYVNKLLGGGDRTSLTLHTHEEGIIRATVDGNPKTVVVMVGGSAIVTEIWRHVTPAIVMAWYPGMEGGHAVADILFGKVNPSGKLPCTFPIDDEQLPFFDRNAVEIDYGYYHGYRLFDAKGYEPAFPFGFGLSYTTYGYDNFRLSREQIGIDGSLEVCVNVTNSGAMAGEEVVQLYVGFGDLPVERAPKELKGFARVALDPGETKEVQLTLDAGQLAYYDAGSATWTVEPGIYEILVGPSSQKENLLAATLAVV